MAERRWRHQKGIERAERRWGGLRKDMRPHLVPGEQAWLSNFVAQPKNVAYDAFREVLSWRRTKRQVERLITSPGERKKEARVSDAP